MLRLIMKGQKHKLTSRNVIKSTRSFEASGTDGLQDFILLENYLKLF